MPYTTYVELSPEDCFETLLTALDAEKRIFYAAKQRHSSSGEYSFRMRKFSPYVNSGFVMFYGTISPSGSGAVIRGHFRISIFMKIFWVIWMLLVSALFVPWLVVGIMSLKDN